MRTQLIEATNGPRNHGKFLVGHFDHEWEARSVIDEWNLLGARGWTPAHVLVLDLQTGEGAIFLPGGLATHDLCERHQLWVCPLFEPFLTWLYAHPHVRTLPRHVDLPDAEFAMSGYRRQREEVGCDVEIGIWRRWAELQVGYHTDPKRRCDDDLRERLTKGVDELRAWELWSAEVMHVPPIVLGGQELRDHLRKRLKQLAELREAQNEWARQLEAQAAEIGQLNERLGTSERRRELLAAELGRVTAELAAAKGAT